MKIINKILTLALSVIASFAITSCVQDSDYDIPNNLGNEENRGLTELLDKIDSGAIQLQTIAEVKNNFNQYEANQIVSQIAIKGYVSSSDETGNFYKEFFLQDSPTNPTATLKIVINQTDTYNQFNIGREVYIYLKNLYIGETNTGDDVISIGGKFEPLNNNVLAITPVQIPKHVFRSTTTEMLTPVELNLSEINDSHIGMFVKLVNVQFPINIAGQPYVNPTDYFDSMRTIESCVNASKFILESSTFASFKNIALPTGGNGTISGIINKNYNGTNLVINLNSTNDVVMGNSRCEL